MLEGRFRLLTLASEDPSGLAFLTDLSMSYSDAFVEEIEGET